MLPDKQPFAPTYPCPKILWLVFGHILWGLMGAFVIYPHGGGYLLRRAVYIGIVFSQVNLLGTWGGLGTAGWPRRLVGVILSVGYLYLLGGIATGDLRFEVFVGMAVGVALVAILMLIVRFYRVVVRMESSTTASPCRIQYSIRHLLILTFVVACLVVIGKTMSTPVAVYIKAYITGTIKSGSTRLPEATQMERGMNLSVRLRLPKMAIRKLGRGH